MQAYDWPIALCNNYLFGQITCKSLSTSYLIDIIYSYCIADYPKTELCDCKKLALMNMDNWYSM